MGGQRGYEARELLGLGGVEASEFVDLAEAVVHGVGVDRRTAERQSGLTPPPTIGSFAPFFTLHAGRPALSQIDEGEKGANEQVWRGGSWVDQARLKRRVRIWNGRSLKLTPPSLRSRSAR